MTDRLNIFEHPVYRKWEKETLAMLTTAQDAENIVAMIDGRPARHAELAFTSLEEIHVIYRPHPERLDSIQHLQHTGLGWLNHKPAREQQ